MRPISEKGPLDKVHETQFAVRQLQRRPAPASAAAGTRPYIQRRMTTTDTIPNNSAGEALDWNTANTTAAAGYFSAPTAQTTRIESQGASTQGEYEFRLGLKWDPEFNASRGIAINAGGFGWFPSSMWKDPYGSGGSIERGDIAHVWCFTARIITTSDFDFTVEVFHEAAADQDVIDAVLEVVYHGASSGDALGTFWF